MILPLNTAECERALSHPNLIKTDARTHLLNTTVNDLMLIRLYGPVLPEFNSSSELEMLWNDVKKQPNFKKQFD